MEDEEDGNDSVVSKYLVHVLNTDDGFVTKKIQNLLPKVLRSSLSSANYHFKELVTTLAQQSFSWSSMI